MAAIYYEDITMDTMGVAIDTEPLLDDTVVYEEFVKTEVLFKKACKQMHRIEMYMHDLHTRWQTAIEAEFENHAYLLQQEGVTWEGMRHYYHTYAARKAEILIELRKVLWEEDLDIETEYIELPDDYAWQYRDEE